MPKIKLPSGKKFKYKTIPLFPGVKQINKSIASENLCLLKKILDDNSIKFQLSAGTLLGAIREGDFISHDEDIDLAFEEEYRFKVLSLLPELKKNGFNLCRYDRRDLYSIMRNGEYIDLYFFRPFKSELSICSGWVIKTSYLLESIPFSFQGEEFLIPKDYKKYLITEYGHNWETPIEWNNYNQPKWRVMLFNLKEYIKDYLPSPLFNYFANKAEKVMINKSLGHLKRIDD